jgi:hypothetical protein
MAASWRSTSGRLRERLEGLTSRRLGAVVLAVLALAVYAVRAIAWPLRGGRDLDEYLFAYIQLFDRDVLLPWSSLFRTPLAPIVDGLSLDVAGGALAEPISALLFAGSVVAWSAAARRFGPWTAIAVAVLLLLYPAYGLMFHELSSEAVFAAAFALWTLLAVRAAEHPSAGRYALVGLGVALLAFARPGNAVLLLFGLFPFLAGKSLAQRARWTAAFAAAALVPMAAWTLHNGIRFDDYTFARGGNAVIPFYRAFITDRIVSPENGESSRRLADAVEEHLLTRNPYKAYGVTLDDVFESGSFRIHEDLYLLSDEVFGWDSAYSIQRKAGIEAVRAHPGTYASGVAKTVWLQLSESLFRELEGESDAAPPASTPSPPPRGLPPPTEGQPIPGGQVVWISRPDNAIRQVWVSPTRFRFSFADPSLRPRFEAILARQRELFGGFPDRAGNETLALWLNRLSRWYPRPILLLAIGAIGVAYRRPRGSAILVAVTLAALLVVVFNALGLFADRHFVLPVAPAFVLLACAAWLAPRRGPGDDRPVTAATVP